MCVLEALAHNLRILYAGIIVMNDTFLSVLMSHQQLRSYDLVLSDSLEKPGIKPVTPGLQGKCFIHYSNFLIEGIPSTVMFCSLNHP